MGSVLEYDDPLFKLSSEPSWEKRLDLAREYLNASSCSVDRIGVALYDKSFDKLRTFSASPLHESPLSNYDFSLSESESLSYFKKVRKPRIVSDMEVFSSGAHEHTQKIRECGFKSSYTLPVYSNDNFLGFVFFNSFQENNFRGQSLEKVANLGQVISQMIVNYSSTLYFMLAALRSTVGIVDYRDPETGNHLKRMAKFSRLIARDLVINQHANFTDEQIDLISHFAPMHDIGKIGTPDSILLKPGPLNDDEWVTMKKHSSIGRHITNHLVADFGFQQIPYIDFLHQIVELHHEKLNGTGYPNGLQGEDVPMAARIIAVSDIFDALTNARPYKKAWKNDEAFQELFEMCQRGLLDVNCVNSLYNNQPVVRAIQSRYSELIS